MTRLSLLLLGFCGILPIFGATRGPAVSLRREGRPARIIGEIRESLRETESPAEPNGTAKPTDRMKRSRLLSLPSPEQAEVLAVPTAGSAEDYSIVFSRTESEDFNLHIVCSFTLRFAEADTVVLRFGGDPEISVTNLAVETRPATGWKRDPENRTIAFAVLPEGVCRIRMEYDYCNLTSAFLYGMHGCELWETSFGEWFYPLIEGTRSRFDLRCELPAGLRFIGGYPAEAGTPEAPTAARRAGGETREGTKSLCGPVRSYETHLAGKITSHSCVFALVDTARYADRIHILGEDTLQLRYMADRALPEARVEELHRLTLAATAYFERCLGPYDDPEAGIVGKPLYLLHSNGYANRNNLNLISVSQAKFATKPHLLPIVHELGHRWLGEWTLFVPDGAEAAYFLKESLNEYMTLSFARAYYGEEWFRELFEKEYKAPVRAQRGSAEERRLIEMRRNDNHTAVYAKGPVIIEQVASKMGRGRWIAFMRRFYTEYRYRPLTYADFLRALAEEDPAAARELDTLVRTY